MSAIPSEGILRKHYEEAVEDVEYKSSAFWQAWMQRAFFETDIYSVTSESSPDGSLRRVDLVVKRYDSFHHTLSALLWVEMKRPTGNIGQVERQALDAALRCLKKDGLIWIYVMTTIGVSFRAWFVERDRPELQPLNGNAAIADWGQYIDIDTDNAIVLNNVVNLVKSQTPLRQAPVIPSQPLEHYAEEKGKMRQEDIQLLPSMVGRVSEQSMQETYKNDQVEPTPNQQSAQAGTQIGSRDYTEVRVDKVPHLTRHDEYIFKDGKGHKKSTARGDWERTTYEGETIWTFQGKKTIYFTRKLG